MNKLETGTSSSTFWLCLSEESAVTTLGMLQLNAALYFWARLSVFNEFYWPLDIVFGLVYTYRVTYFFLMVADDNNSTRRAYFHAHQNSWYVLALAAATLIIMLTIEWAHLPLLQVVSWSMVTIFNWYNINMLAVHANIVNYRLKASAEYSK